MLYSIGKLSASAFEQCNYFYVKINNFCKNKHFRSGLLLL